jgi:hypothetical protein
MMTTANQPVTAAETEPAEVDEAVMELLQEHVPLALLCDLSAPEGPPSAEIMAEEGLPADEWWKQ